MSTTNLENSKFSFKIGNNGTSLKRRNVLIPVKWVRAISPNICHLGTRVVLSRRQWRSSGVGAAEK